jgi:hypothetical protein
VKRHVRNLFLLRVVGEGQPGAGEPAEPPAGGGAGDGRGDGGGEPGAQPPKTISVAEHKKVQREAQNLRGRLRAAEDNLKKVLEHLGIDKVEDLASLNGGDPEPPTPPVTTGTPPPVKTQRTADDIQKDRQVTELQRKMAKMEEEAERSRQKIIKQQRDMAIGKQIQELGITDPQEVETAFSTLEKRTVTHVDGDNVSFTQKFTDPKTKEELEEPPSLQTASLILPKALQPARGGPGSGGGTPRLSSDPKDNDLLQKAVGSQAEYEKNRAAVITAERQQIARSGSSAVTTDTGSR